MVKKVLMIVVVSICFMGSIAQAGRCNIEEGVSNWINELKSTMSINIDASGIFTGEYTTAVSCTGGPLRRRHYKVSVLVTLCIFL